MVVYNRILEASEAARETGFSVEKKDLVRKFLLNPLLPVFSLFADFYISTSAEALDLSRSETRLRSASPKKKAKVSNSHEYGEMTSPDDLSSIHTSPEIALEDSSPTTPPPNKRVFSGESYGQQSTETTLQKMNHAEPLTQALQNALIGILLTQVWFGEVQIPWARNRKMYLDYRPYPLTHSSLIVGPFRHPSAVALTETRGLLLTASLPFPTAPSSSSQTKNPIQIVV
jgi:hypothetical protein